MNKANISFQGSEGLVFSAASRIYAAFLAAGKVTTGQEQHWMDQAIRQAIQLARMTDQNGPKRQRIGLRQAIAQVQASD